MKTILTTAAAELAKMARAEGVLAVVILADEKSPAIEIISLEQWSAQWEALARAERFLTPRRPTN